MSFKQFLATFICATSIATAALADESASAHSDDSYQKSTTRNPLTKTTTTTTQEKGTRKFKRNNHSYTAEDEVKVKKKVSGDGKTTQVIREEMTTEKSD
jgi:hypothetical protein